jgi:hypothetical protein
MKDEGWLLTSVSHFCLLLSLFLRGPGPLLQAHPPSPRVVVEFVVRGAPRRR